MGIAGQCGFGGPKGLFPRYLSKLISNPNLWILNNDSHSYKPLYIAGKSLFLNRNMEQIGIWIAAMVGLMYDERMGRLGLYLLEFRWMRGDLIETYKILRGLDKIDAGKTFPMLGDSRTREHSLRACPTFTT